MILAGGRQQLPQGSLLFLSALEQVLFTLIWLSLLTVALFRKQIVSFPSGNRLCPSCLSVFLFVLLIRRHLQSKKQQLEVYTANVDKVSTWKVNTSWKAPAGLKNGHVSHLLRLLINAQLHCVSDDDKNNWVNLEGRN